MNVVRLLARILRLGRLATWIAGILVVASPAPAARAGEADSLGQAFLSPPAEARPTVWWRFMDDCMTMDGIRADLDAMRGFGASGAIVSFVSSRGNLCKPAAGAPQVPVLSDAWWTMVEKMILEAGHRDLDLWFQACPGFATSGGPWIQPEHSMQKLVWRTVDIEAGKGMGVVLTRPDVDKKWNFYRDVAVLAWPNGGPDVAVAPEQVVNLTSRMRPDGKLDWNPPAGKWRIARFGHTTTGKEIHPVTRTGLGLECDKLSAMATRIQFDNYFGKILAMRPRGAKGKVELFYDSWEAGNQNWTPGFPEAFRRHRGYDMLAWLPVAAGQIIGNEEMSRRFDHDWRTTIAEMINTEHFSVLARLARENGAGEFRAQPYNGPVNFMTAGALFDHPEGEFWHDNKNYGWWTLRMIASVGHVHGRKIVSAEALTASPENVRFDIDPFATKAETDLAFAMGINQFAVVHQPHNPWPHLKPGMSAGPYGMLLGGGQSWAPLAGSWVDYLARCCHLLRQGVYAADVVTLFRPGQRGFEPPPGYAGDICDEERIVAAMTFDGYALCLPGGMRYRLLELVDTTKVLSPDLSPSGIERRLSGKPRPQTYSLPLMRKVRELVMAGATMLGPRPTSCPGMGGYPECDDEMERIAVELWGPPEIPGRIDRKVGNGRVLAGMTVPEALASIGVAPDFKTMESIPSNRLPWIHRRMGEDDWYFLSNQQDEAMRVTASFRLDGRAPEFWHPDTGNVEAARQWRRNEGRTEVVVDLASRGSVFVRFSPSNQSPPGLEVESVASVSLKLQGPWHVRFSPAMGVPDPLEFAELSCWTTRPEAGVRHYSGVAVYTKSMDVPAGIIGEGKSIVLDLGEVRHLARVSVNGTTFPALWKPPFRCDVSAAVKPGKNALVIEVANLWVNRLIGDEREPADIAWGPIRWSSEKRFAGQPLGAWPSWLLGNSPRPSSGRRAFSTWNYIEKNQELVPSGLLGPVSLVISNHRPPESSSPGQTQPETP